MRLWLSFIGIVMLALLPLASAPDDAAKPAGDELVYVSMKTSKGEIVIELNQTKAPISVKNFLAYVDAKFYDGTIFHRVMKAWIVQGGGFTKDMKQKGTQAPIKNESANGLKNRRGTIAMARLPQPDTATSQFYFNLKDNAGLDGADGRAGYAVFGRIVAGLKVADTIGDQPTEARPPQHENVPVEAITIESVTRLSAEDAKKKIDAEAPAKK